MPAAVLYDTVVYTGGVYGGTGLVTLSQAIVIGDNIIQLTFSGDVVNNVQYNNPANYIFSLIVGSGSPITTVQVLSNNLTSTNVVYLLTNYHTPGGTYQLTVSNLNSRNGSTVTGSVKFTSIVTKLDTMYSNIPAHFSKDPNSLVRNILAAISISDGRIGRQ